MYSLYGSTWVCPRPSTVQEMANLLLEQRGTTPVISVGNKWGYILYNGTLPCYPDSRDVINVIGVDFELKDSDSILFKNKSFNLELTRTTFITSTRPVSR